MASLPNRDVFGEPTDNQQGSFIAQQKTVWDYLVGLFGQDGTVDTACATLGGVLTKTNITGASTSTPVDADLFPTIQSSTIKKLSWAGFKSALKSYFDTVYAPIAAAISSDFSYKSTPVSITSWSYSGTTITLNVASHTFVANDYIEVSGLTSTTYPANGIHKVTSVTSTTIVFTLEATPTGTAGVSSATVKGYATVNGKIVGGLGIGQTWQALPAVLGATYYNTSGKANELAIICQNTSAGMQLQIIINGYYTVALGFTYAANGYVGGQVTIPAGASFLIQMSGGTPTLTNLSILR